MFGQAEIYFFLYYYRTGEQIDLTKYNNIITNLASRLRHLICNVFIRLINRFCNGNDVLTRGFCARL